jgi:arylsulfatase
MMKHEKRNLLLISLDTLRADVAYRGPLPSFHALCERGTVFDHTVSSAPITPISHASVFTGLQPYEHGVRHLFRERLSTPVPTLAQLLSGAGYHTGAVVSCPGLNRWYRMHVGFSHYDDEIPRLQDGSDPLTTADVKMRGTALKRAPLVVERGLAWLEAHLRERGAEPFFLFLHFFDTHWPYEPPEWYAPEGANPYEGEAAYLDHYLGRLFQRLESWGLLDGGTLVVLFSDHGEDLAGWYPNDHGGAALGHPEEEGHGCLLFDATQMVPLAFLAPGLVPAGRRVDTQVRLVDILPTIADLLGVGDPAPRSGRTLRGLFTGTEPHRTAYCEAYHREEQVAVPGLGPWRGLRIDNRFKVIFDLLTQTFQVYDLEADPCESRPDRFANELLLPRLG